MIFRVFCFSLQKLSPCVPTIAVQEKSCARFPAVTRLTVYRRPPLPPGTSYLVELFGNDELKEFRRGMELVGPAGRGGQ
eukprot:7212102-Pyramimonas_sp.AAC.1